MSDQARACRLALPKAQLALAKSHAHMLRTLAVRPTSDPIIDITNHYDRHTRICTVTIRLTWPTVYTYPPGEAGHRLPRPDAPNPSIPKPHKTLHAAELFEEVL